MRSASPDVDSGTGKVMSVSYTDEKRQKSALASKGQSLLLLQLYVRISNFQKLTNIINQM